MRDYFIGVFPTEEAVNKITRISAEIAEMFATQGIPVRWIEPEKYHVTVLFAGKNMNFFRKKFVSYRLKRYRFAPFAVSLGEVKLGISKKYREIVFLSVENGADQLRDIVPDLAARLHINRETVFIPHISLGRVSKDLSDMEFKNLTDDIELFNKHCKEFCDIEFPANKLYFVESDMKEYRLVA